MTRDEHGVTVIAALLAVLLMGAMGAGLAYFTASNQQTRVQQVTRDQAYYSNVAGMEFALGQILTGGSGSASFTRKFAGETFTVTRAGGTMTIQSGKLNAVSSHSINDPFDASVCLVVNTGAVALSAPYTQLTGITLSRDASCTQAVVINSMTGTSWTPDNGENLTGIQIASNPVEFSGSEEGGGTFDFGANDYTIDDGNQHNLTYLQWDTSVFNHNFQLVFNYTYGTSTYSKSVTVNMQSMANCFTWTTTSAVMTYTTNAWRDLTGTTVSNSCTTDINLTNMTVTWGPSNNLTNVQMNGGAEEFTGSAGSGTQIAAANTITASSSQTVNYLRFDGEMLGQNHTVIYTFSDGSTKSYDLNVFNSSQNNCLTINTGSAAISGNDVTGVTVQNTCAADVGITGVTLTWSGGPTLFTGISINDIRGSANVYSGSFASGVLLDFETVNSVASGNYYTDGSGAKNVNYLRFNSSPAGVSLTLTFTMSDGTAKVVTFTPNSQANCMTVQMLATILGNGNVQIQGITLTNTCAYQITWAQTQNTWTGTRNMTRIRVSGNDIWTGSVASGTLVNNNDVVFNASQTVTVDYFRWSGGMTNQQVYFSYIMGDGSTVSSAEFTEKYCLVPNTAGANISGNDLQGVTVQNQCTARSITWDRTTLTCVPSAPTVNTTQIVVNGTTIYNNVTGVACGTQINNTDYAIPASTTRTINRFRFNGAITGRAFTIAFRMLDVSTDTTPSFSPP